MSQGSNRIYDIEPGELPQRNWDEFEEGADQWEMDGVTRRSFMKRMGAAMALAGVAGTVGCDQRPANEVIVPYVNPPVGVVPGKPLTFATAMPFMGHARGVLVTQREGRPIKIEGNPDHPATLGGTDVFMQASILDLYDPARTKSPTRGGSVVDWSGFFGALAPRLDAARANQGRGLRVLSGVVTSPTLAAQMQRFATMFPEARWHHYDPITHDTTHAATLASFGRALDVTYDFARAKVIVSLDSDFLFEENGSPRYARQFIDGRRVRKDRTEMNRLYCVESTLSLTGSMADHRWAVRPTEVADFARSLLAAINGQGGDQRASAIAKDLTGHRGAAVVVAGPSQPAVVHSLAYAMNAALGNIGTTVRFSRPAEVGAGDESRSLAALTDDMLNGRVDTLLIFGENPAFTAPADVPFATALETLSKQRDADGRLKNFTAYLGLYGNETSFISQWTLPEAHYLESWGDLRAFDGTASIIQPLISPLYGGRSVQEVLSQMMGEVGSGGYEIVRTYWRSQVGGDFEAWWREALRKGVIDRTVAAGVDPGTPRAAAIAVGPATRPAADRLQITFRPDYSVWDGAFARNAWLQETPRPFTKLVWDNAAILSPNTASRYGLEEGNLVQLKADGRTLELPVYVMQNFPDDTVTIHLGYGAGKRPATTADDGVGVTGFNAFALRTGAAGFLTDVELVKTGRDYQLVTTRERGAMQDGSGPLSGNAVVTPQTPELDKETNNRRLVRIATIGEFKENPDIVADMGGHKDKKPLLMLYNGGWDYSKGYQWGMSIDTNACIGCNACMVACQSENNIAVVGKEEVFRQRDMHWLRIDEYIANDASQTITHQPVPCMHCEDAPCEYVCPVGATSHSDDGLNQMTYNRCVGTRYCSNNCAYKVRRFNFFDFSQDRQSPQRKLQQNPEVTVRTRGVMEKCSYCVQRISRTRIEVEAMLLDLQDEIERTTDPAAKAKLEQQRKDREFEMIEGLDSACAQACPTKAIVFGSITPVAEQKTEVMAAKGEPTDYVLLRELTTKPRTSYMGRFRNPNPALS